MPIDNIAQLSLAQVRPVKPAPAVPDAVPADSAKRQDLPGSGQGMPAVAGADVQKAVSRINDYIQTLRRDLKFRVDQETDQVVVTVVDSQSGEVIRQIPSEEVLAVARSLDRAQPGLLLDAKA